MRSRLGWRQNLGCLPVYGYYSDGRTDNFRLARNLATSPGTRCSPARYVRSVVDSGELGMELAPAQGLDLGPGLSFRDISLLLCSSSSKRGQMLRRRFLKLAGTLVPAALLPYPVVALEAKGKLRRRVRPSDAAWPSAAEWERLNQAVGGNLLKPQALFASCAADQNSSACADVKKNLRNPFYISDQPAGTEVPRSRQEKASPASTLFATPISEEQRRELEQLVIRPRFAD